MSENKTLCIIGGGAAGLMAAIHAARMGVAVTVMERNERCGRKLAITGKGRCNVTNHCTREQFFENVTGPPQSSFLRSWACP